MTTSNYSAMVLNLTQHLGNEDQKKDGLRDVNNISLLKSYLDVPEDALKASDDVLDGLLNGKVQRIIAEFVLPEQAKRLLGFAEQFDPATGPTEGTAEILNAAWRSFHLRVMVGGAPILMEKLLPALVKVGAVPVYSLSARDSRDELQPDGSIKKVSYHRHLRFREARVS